MAKPTATIHITGTITYPSKDHASDSTSGVLLPLDMEKLTIVGEGANATLAIRGADTFRMQSATELDNFKLTSTTALYITGEFNDVTITDTFTTDNTKAKYFFLGYRVWYADAAQDAYDTAAGVSSDSDVTAVINGGTWTCFNCGNYRLTAASAFGTYSGDMTVTLGGNATVQINSFDGAMGMNYLSGSLDFTVDCDWKSTIICEHTPIANSSTNVAASRALFDPSKNTGKVTMHKGAGVSATIYLGYDFDKNGTLTLHDALEGLRFAIDGCSDTLMTRRYYSFDRVDLAAVLHILRLLSE